MAFILLFGSAHTVVLSEQFVKATMAIWLVVLLLERALVQLLETEGADEMLRMKFAEHGGYAATGDRFRASRA